MSDSDPLKTKMLKELETLADNIAMDMKDNPAEIIGGFQHQRGAALRGPTKLSEVDRYIYNPKECVILAYKNSPKKEVKGEPQWVGTIDEIEMEDGTKKKKTLYTDEDKKDFMDLVFGQWKYFADTKQMTKATFSIDIPSKAIKILTYKNDIVLDPFAGSGTSLVSAEILDRRWVGIELSPNYAEVARKRVQGFVDQKKQLRLEGV